MNAVMNDAREDKDTRPWGYVVSTDSFMSGRLAPGRSLYCVAVCNWKEAEIVLQNAQDRSDMKRPRLVTRMRKDGTPIMRTFPGDHIKVVDRGTADTWYECGRPFLR